MDDLSAGGAELRQALQHLRRLNRLFGAAAPTLFGVRRLWEQMGKPQRLSVLDIGAGSGDVNRRLLRWAAAAGVDMTITVADVTEEACEEARLQFLREPRVQVEQADLFELSDGCADIVTGTQFVHHFDEEALPLAVGRMVRASRWGAVLGDIHRSRIAWLAVWLAAHSLSRNRYIRHDGPLSVAKGFRADDWNRLRKQLGMDESQLYAAWRPLYRYAVVIRKIANPADG
jgi:2-polyprenyl-3-methyl-5-hydroxy-6-metoxy-1,4-benzoquinol methylase